MKNLIGSTLNGSIIFVTVCMYKIKYVEQNLIARQYYHIGKWRMALPNNVHVHYGFSVQLKVIHELKTPEQISVIWIALRS